MPDDEQEEMDFSKEVEWPESDTEQQESKLVEVSEKTKKFLEEKCTRRVQNSVRLQTRGKYSPPKVVATKTPHLDSYLRTELSSVTKNKPSCWMHLHLLPQFWRQIARRPLTMK